MRNIFLLACILLCLPAPPPALLAALSAPEADAPAPPAQPRLRKTGPDTYQIGTVQLDAAARTIRCGGHVNMAEGGAIELLACLPWGKTHESVLTLDIVPMDLQLALLLLGLTFGRNPAVEYELDDAFAAHWPPGETVRISVQWTPPADEGQKPEVRTVPAESLLVNVQTHQPLSEAPWVFLGSRIADGRFGADIDGSIVTTYHDPLAILELAHETVNDDIYYEVNTALCPPVGTAVTLIIHAPLPEPEAGPPRPGEAAQTNPSPNRKETGHGQVDRNGAA